MKYKKVSSCPLIDGKYYTYLYEIIPLNQNNDFTMIKSKDLKSPPNKFNKEFKTLNNKDLNHMMSLVILSLGQLNILMMFIELHLIKKVLTQNTIKFKGLLLFWIRC